MGPRGAVAPRDDANGAAPEAKLLDVGLAKLRPPAVGGMVLSEAPTTVTSTLETAEPWVRRAGARSDENRAS